MTGSLRAARGRKSSPDLLLATSVAIEDGEPGHEALDAALAHRGISSAWVAWDDPLVDWGASRLTVALSINDFDDRLADFLGWATGLGSRLLHGVEILRWNTDKSYLVQLASASSVPTVPTALCSNPVELRKAIGRFGTSVVKPRFGTGGRGIVLVYDSESWLPVDQGPWIVQPLLENVHYEGVVSVYVIDGRPVSSVRRVAGHDDIRSSPEFGGTLLATDLILEAQLLAVDALAAATEIVGKEIVYARVGLLRRAGSLLVLGVELTAPSLELTHLPDNAERFADALASRL